MKRRSVLVLVALLGLVVLVVGAVDYLNRDRCLDAGGRWTADARTCEGVGQ